MPNPGVGYVPDPAISRAGGGYYRMDLTAHPTAFPPGSAEEAAALGKRYSEKWRSPPEGVHTPSIAQYLEQDYEAAVSTGIPPKWAPPGWKASDWSGKATDEEKNDVLYTSDKRVTTRNVPRPDPAPDPRPTPRPDPKPGPQPSPSKLSPVAQSAAELEAQLLGGLPAGSWRVLATGLAGSGLLVRLIKAGLKVYRKHMGEPTS